jgi:CHAT domain-containing protein
VVAVAEALAPALDVLLGTAGLERIAVVPTLSLHRFPFPALPAGEGLLIDRFEVSVLPSFRDALRRAPAATGAPLFLGDPADPLFPTRQAELRAIEGAMGPLRVASGASLDASPFGVETALHVHGHGAQIPVLTPSIHGAFTHEQAVCLADCASEHPVLLGPDAIWRARRPLSLVSLSVCASGQPEVQPNTGQVSSLATAFIESGAWAVAAPVWDIETGAAPALTRALYANTSAGLPPAAAFRASLRELRGSAELDTHDWSAYVLFGGFDASREAHSDSPTPGRAVAGPAPQE